MRVTIRETPDDSRGDGMHPKKRLTRKQLGAFLREEHGYPIGDSTLDKLCMPTINQGPPVAGWWGRRPLYDPDEGLAWAEARIKVGRTRERRL
jgi:hypothetical protein